MRKILSMFLALSMIFTMLPISAMAEEAEMMPKTTQTVGYTFSAPITIGSNTDVSWKFMILTDPDGGTNGTVKILFPNSGVEQKITGDLIIPETVNYNAQTYDVTEISTHTFNSCKISRVFIPKTIGGSIGSDAFGGSYDITAFDVDSANTAFISVDGVLYNKEKTTLIKYPPAKEGETFTIPASVTTLSAVAFGHCTNITSMDIPENVTVMESHIFYDCSALTNVTIGSGVSEIPHAAFIGCSALQRMTFNRMTAPKLSVSAFPSNLEDFPKNLKIKVPAGSTGYTGEGASEAWKALASNIEPATAHTITATTGAGGRISPSGNVTVNSGELQSFDITPNSNYSIADVKVDGVSQGKITSYTFHDVAANHTIDATFTYNGGGGSGGRGGGSGSGERPTDNSSSVIVIPPAPDKPNSPTQGEIKVPGTMDSNGNITVNITDKTVTDAFDKALADAKKNGNEQNGITVVLRVDTGSKTGSNVTVNLPKTVQDTIIAKKIASTIVVVDNPDIRIGMDLATVQEINSQAKSDVSITTTHTDSSKLTGDAKKAIGGRPVFDLKVNYGSGKEVSSFGTGSVSVTIPYTLGANEKAGNVQAVYVDSNGKVHWIVNSVYDSVEKVLHFSTDHFSTYGVGYKQPNIAFVDIAGHWAKEGVEFVVSHGLFSGTSTTNFSPNTAMTRGMFVTALGRLANADVSVYKQSSFSDVKNDAYYMGYIEWASKNNIVNGVGNKKFAPDQSITREQMAVIMSNYAKTMGYTLPKVHEENIFADNVKISTYAKEAVKQMQMAGVISGKNSNLFDPQGVSTRGEVSTVLRRFVEMAISGDTAQG